MQAHKDTIAIIGGTGMNSLPPEYVVEPLEVSTEHGVAHLWRAQSADLGFYFLSRHGVHHSVPPHRVNYQANIAAIRSLGIRRVLATNAVGSLRNDLLPRTLVLLSDFLDMTRGRVRSFWDDSRENMGVVHTSFSEPYCPGLRSALAAAAESEGVAVQMAATYVCVEGPRFESPAEVRYFRQIGGDVVGMTGLPEATMAREAGLCYAALGLVTNLAAGLSDEEPAHAEVQKIVEQCAPAIRAILLKVIAGAAQIPPCRCSS
jgi:5'-methylthioadenosine phosphorylase